MSLRLQAAKRLLLAIVLSAGALLIFGGGKVSANHQGPSTYTPNPGPLPASVSNYLSTECGHSGLSPAFITWISAAGAPATTTLNVPYGTASVSLDLHFAGVVCYPNSGGTDETRTHITGASASPPGTISGLVGDTLRIVWANGTHQDPGQYRQAADRFTYAPTGGFRTSGTYRITVDTQGVSHFDAGFYRCPAPPGGDPGGWNYSRCPTNSPTFGIFVNVGPPPSVDCNSITINPASPEPGQAFTVTGGFTISGQAGPNISASLSATIPSLGFNQSLFSGSVSRNVSINRTTSPITGPAGTHAGRFNVSVPLGDPTSLQCPFTVVIAEKPYYRVYGGDVSVGSGFGATCTVDPAGTMIGFNRGANPFTGAGSQLATYALGTIIDFATGQIRAPNDPNHLSFANTTTYGGGLNPTYATCAPDYFARRTGSDPGANWNIPASANGTFSHTGDMAITADAAGLAFSSRVTLYVDGDLFINDDIKYRNTGSYADITQIPSFRFIVRGNIYVAPGVSQLDGIYIAQSNGASGGRFYTCWPGHLPTAADLNGACRSRLTVFGAVLAETIKLTRTTGSVNQSTTAERYNSGGNPAEVFVFSPEVWLAGDLSSSSGAFDSINVLPPVL